MTNPIDLMREDPGKRRGLPNGWRVGEEYSISTQEEYVKEMVAEALSRPRPKVIPTTTQCVSTQATLDRDPSQDEAHWNRHLPEGVQVKQVERPITPEEYKTAQAARDSQKNTMGESKLSSVTREKRSLGIQAFTYSEPASPAKSDLSRLIGMAEIKAVLPEFKGPPEETARISSLSFRVSQWLYDKTGTWWW